MVIAQVREFLESSTIHGLVHISTAKSRTARVLWATIVVACFASAIWMIMDSYKDWQESPVSTTITTHPINELQFPEVTVCPPRESNTLVNHPLRKVKTVNFTEDERNDLIGISKPVFFKSYATKMAELLSTENIRSISNGKTEMPRIDDQGIIEMKSYELEGSFRTPDFQSSDNQGDFYSRVQSLHYVLDLPWKIRAMVANHGALVINVQSEGSWSYMLQGGMLQLHKTPMNHSAAEEYCVKRGGLLASIGSK